MNSNTDFIRDEHGRITHVVKHVDAAQKEVYDALITLRDPHLPRVFSITQDGSEWIVEREYINGVSLEDMSQLEDAELLRAALDITQALCCIHSAIPAIIHRDVKPANIIRRNEGGYVLIDFDAARLYKAHIDRDTTLIGTVGYAPPEQFGFMQTDERSDVYALGTTLYELKTGAPYRAGDQCPGRLRRVIRKCTAFSPEKRYRDAHSLRKALLRLKNRPMQHVVPILCAVLGAAAGFAAAMSLEKTPAAAVPSVTPTATVSAFSSALPSPTVAPTASPAETPSPSPQAEPIAVRYTAVPHEVYEEFEGDETCICGLDIRKMQLLAPCDGVIELSEGTKAEVELALDVPLTYTEECRAAQHNRPQLAGVRIKRCTLGGRADVDENGAVIIYEEGVYEIDAMVAFDGDYRGPLSIYLIAAQDTRAYTDCKCVFDISSVEYILPSYSLPADGSPVEIDLKYKTPVIDDRMCTSEVHAQLLFMPAGWLSAPESSDVTVDADNILRTTTPGAYQLDIPMWFRNSEEDHFHYNIIIR